MYCSSCGQAVNQGLSYCNHCGAKVSGAKEPDVSKLSEASLNFILVGILGIPIAGLGILIGLMSVMKKELGFSNESTIAFALLGFLLLLAAETVFIWLLIHRTKMGKETGHIAQLREVVTKGLDEAQVRELPEPIPSVTENTTRSLEPMPRETRTR